MAMTADEFRNSLLLLVLNLVDADEFARELFSHGTWNDLIAIAMWDDPFVIWMWDEFRKDPVSFCIDATPEQRNAIFNIIKKQLAKLQKHEMEISND